MTKDEKITEELKVLENKFLSVKSDMQSVKEKLRFAYDYEDELEQRRAAARLKTEELAKEYHQKVCEIQNIFADMKNKLDVFTGNFLKTR